MSDVVSSESVKGQNLSALEIEILRHIVCFTRREHTTIPLVQCCGWMTIDKEELMKEFSRETWIMGKEWTRDNPNRTEEKANPYYSNPSLIEAAIDHLAEMKMVTPYRKWTHHYIAADIEGINALIETGDLKLSSHEEERVRQRITEDNKKIKVLVTQQERHAELKKDPLKAPKRSTIRMGDVEEILITRLGSGHPQMQKIMGLLQEKTIKHGPHSK